MINKIAEAWFAQAKLFRSLEQQSTKMPVPTPEISARLTEESQRLAALEAQMQAEQPSCIQEVEALLDVGIALLENPDAAPLARQLVQNARAGLLPRG